MPPNDPVVYVVRHGQTILNSERKFRGSANPPLDDTGLKQAQRLAKIFEPIEISHIFCSDKQRSTKTAEIIASAKGIPVHQTEGLRALDVGTFSGTKRDKDSEAALQVYLDSPDTQIPGGESLNEFKSRIAPCLEQAIDIYCETGKPPILVAHSSVVHEVGSLAYSDHKSVLVEPGGVIAVYVTNGKLGAEPIFRPVKNSGASQAETIT
jgi:alpha-ribazole phosphatase